MPNTKMNDIAARLKAAEQEYKETVARIKAEEQAREAELDRTIKRSGRAYVQLVEELMEHFGIDAEPLQQRQNKKTGEVFLDKKGRPRMLDPDPDGSRRAERLRAAILESPAEPESDATEDTSEEAEYGSEQDSDHVSNGAPHTTVAEGSYTT